MSRRDIDDQVTDVSFAYSLEMIADCADVVTIHECGFRLENTPSLDYEFMKSAARLLRLQL